METTAEQRTHEALLRTLAKCAGSGFPADRDALNAGADALARVAALEAALAVVHDELAARVDGGEVSLEGALLELETVLPGGKPAALGVTQDTPGGTR